ncbi:hypothetical protein CFP56_017697 [Quercus suber]|uniref:Uncharacterized protein n=1 Tax=Quercus suber TaxID=58331 RepID=A0AAW0M0C5_QUESU
MKQTVAIRVSMDRQRCFFCIKKGDEARKKAMKIAGWNQHVLKVRSRTNRGKRRGIDTAELAMLLRKKVGYASIVSVAEDKKEEKKEEKEDETKIQYMAGSGTHSHGYNMPPYTLLFCEIREPVMTHMLAPSCNFTFIFVIGVYNALSTIYLVSLRINGSL